MLVALDPLDRADLLWRRARARSALGAYRTALAEATRGYRLLADRDDQPARAARARLTSLQASVRHRQQRALPARKLAERAAGEARAADDGAALAVAYIVSEWANRVLGDTDSSGFNEQALEIYEQLGDLHGAGMASNNLGGIAYLEGRWDDSVAWYRRAIDLYRRCGNEVRAATVASNLGELLVSRGAFEEADAMLCDAVRVLRASRALDDLLFAEVQVGRLYVERGEPAQGIDHLSRIRQEAATLGQVGFAFEAAMHLAEAWVRLGRDENALCTLEDAVTHVGTVDAVYRSTFERVRAEALSGNGRLAEARAAVNAGLECARDQGLLYDEGLLRLAAVQLDRAEGIDPGSEALDAIEALFRRLNIDTPRAGLDAREPPVLVL
jgi:tetratricopeptide (TPR) repeat protein